MPTFTERNDHVWTANSHPVTGSRQARRCAARFVTASSKRHWCGTSAASGGSLLAVTRGTLSRARLVPDGSDLAAPARDFAVNKPFGTARRVVVDGREVFSFPTVWNSVPREKQRTRVDPLDARYWQIDRSAGEHEVY